MCTHECMLLHIQRRALYTLLLVPCCLFLRALPVNSKQQSRTHSSTRAHRPSMFVQTPQHKTYKRNAIYAYLNCMCRIIANAHAGPQTSACGTLLYYTTRSRYKRCTEVRDRRRGARTIAHIPMPARVQWLCVRCVCAAPNMRRYFRKLRHSTRMRL